MFKDKQSLIPKLIFLCLITTSIVTTFTLSKYINVEEKSDFAKVGTFSFTAIGNGSTDLLIDCNQDTPTATYQINVTNEKNNIVSDVAMKYDIIVEFGQAIPAGVTISIDDSNNTFSGGQSKYIFENIGQFSAGNKESRTHTLILSGSKTILENFDTTMSINVCSEQID